MLFYNRRTFVGACGSEWLLLTESFFPDSFKTGQFMEAKGVSLADDHVLRLLSDIHGEDLILKRFDFRLSKQVLSQFQLILILALGNPLQL